MGKIKDLKVLESLVKKYKSENKRIVLVTGVYDILHIGHVRFLKKAKEAGDVLIVALDGDAVVRYIKDGRRPINEENHRAEVLESLEFVDYIFIFHNEKPKFVDWLRFCELIKPDILAVTQNDPLLKEKKEALERIGCLVEVATEYVENQSTTRIAKLLSID